MPSPAMLWASHPLWALGLSVFAQKIGVPIPTLPLLLLMGGQAARDPGLAAAALCVATIAALPGDTAWYLAGRRLGPRVLGLLCRISVSPDTCVRRSELDFIRHGPRAVVLAKFIPGISVVAPPMAGAMGMTPKRFAMLNLLGTLLWAAAGLAGGALAHRQIVTLLQWAERSKSMALTVTCSAVVAYLIWRVVRRQRAARQLRRLPRVSAEALRQKLRQGSPVVVIDVRGPHAQDPAIPGSLPLPLTALHAVIARAGCSETEFVTYCDCPRDASAARAALWLMQQGLRTRVLAGGWSAWQALEAEPAGPRPVATVEPAQPTLPGSGALRTACCS